ncbi:MAG TPA: Gldg family protein, partial [Patescibacteria group bacterium]
DKIHSLSNVSKNVVKNLDDVVTVKVFMTQDLPPEVQPVAADLKTVLSELQNINQKRFKVAYVDPSKDNDAKTEAAKLGIEPLQFSSVKSDKFEVQNAYFGLVMYYGDNREVLPVAGDVGNLEYFLISDIKKLTSKTIPTVAIAEENTSSSQGSVNQFFEQFLAKSYKVVNVNLDGDDTIPDNAQDLVIIGRSKKMEDKGLQKVKEWVDKDKGLIVFLGKFKISAGMQGQAAGDPGLEQLLKDKGIEIEPKLILDKSSSIANFRSQNGNFLTQYPYWVQVRPENMNDKTPVLSGINSIMLPWTSPLKLSNGASALFSSSANSLSDDNISDLSPLSKKTFDKSQMNKMVLAAINTDKGNKIAVVGNSDFISDQFLQSNQQNLFFALNMVDYFSQDSSLLAIRGKSLKDAPLNIVDDKTKTMVKTANMAAPLLIIITSLALSNYLRKKKNNKWYEESQ